MDLIIWLIQIPAFGCLGYLTATRWLPAGLRRSASAGLLCGLAALIWLVDLEPPGERSTIRSTGAVLSTGAFLMAWAFHWFALGSVGGFRKPARA